jgi:hypothetical protein
MIVWQVLYGQPLAVPQGPSFMQWTSPHPLLVLLSDNHGLFSWAPLLVLSTVGLVLFIRNHPDAAWPFGVALITAWYVNAAVVDWWAGEAFGARRFLSLYPLFVLGLARWVSKAQTEPAFGRVAVVVLLVVANGLLLLQYQVFMKGLPDLAPYPHGWSHLFLTRFVVPFRLLGW